MIEFRVIAREGYEIEIDLEPQNVPDKGRQEKTGPNKEEQGPISLTNFPSQFKCDGNFILLSSKY